MTFFSSFDPIHDTDFYYALQKGGWLPSAEVEALFNADPAKPAETEDFQVSDQPPSSAPLPGFSGFCHPYAWKKAADERKRMFHDPLLQWIMEQKEMPAKMLARDSFLTIEQGEKLFECMQLQVLRVPETLRFFLKNTELLHREEGRAIFSYLLFGLKEEALQDETGWIQLPPVTQLIPMAMEAKADPSFQSGNMLWEILGVLASHGCKNQDPSMLQFVWQVQEWMEKSLRPKAAQGQFSALPFIDVISEEQFHHLIKSSPASQLLDYSVVYFARAEKKQNIDYFWLKNFIKASYLLARKTYKFPKEPLLGKYLAQGKERLIGALAQKCPSCLLEEVFLLANIEKPTDSCRYCPETVSLQQGDYVFEILTGCLKKGNRPSLSFNLVEEDQSWMEAVLLPGEDLSQFMYCEKEEIFSLPEKKAAMKKGEDGWIASCSGERLLFVLKNVCAGRLMDSAASIGGLLYLNNPLIPVRTYTQKLNNLDFAFAAQPQDYTGHPKYQRWLSIDSAQIFVLHTEEPRAFCLKQEKDGIQIYDLARFAKRKDFRQISLGACFASFPEHPWHVWAWEDPFTNVLQRIELPRYGISFIKESNWTCEQYKGYSIEEGHQPLHGFIQMIPLKNSQGDRIMLLPKALSIHQPPQPSGIPAIDPDPLQPQEFYVFHKKNEEAAAHSITTGYTCSDPQALLFLASLHLQAKNYHDAFYYLQQVPGHFSDQNMIGLLVQVVQRECYQAAYYDQSSHAAVLLHFIKKLLRISLRSFVRANPLEQIHEFSYVSTLFGELPIIIRSYLDNKHLVDFSLRITKAEWQEMYTSAYKQNMPYCLQEHLSHASKKNLSLKRKQKEQLTKPSKKGRAQAKSLEQASASQSTKVRATILLERVFTGNFESSPNRKMETARLAPQSKETNHSNLPFTIHSQLFARLQQKFFAAPTHAYRFKKNITQALFLKQIETERKSELIRLSTLGNALCQHALFAGSRIKTNGCKQYGWLEQKAIEQNIGKILSKHVSGKFPKELLASIKEYMLSSLIYKNLCYIEYAAGDPFSTENELGKLAKAIHYEELQWKGNEGALILYVEMVLGKALTLQQLNFIRGAYTEEKSIFYMDGGTSQNLLLAMLSSLLEAQKNRLAIHIVPFAHRKNYAAGLEKLAAKLNHPGCYVFQFDLDYSTVDSLSLLHEQLQNAYNSKRILVMHPHAVQVLLLSYLHQLEKGISLKDSLEENRALPLLEKTLCILMQSGAAILNGTQHFLRSAQCISWALEKNRKISRTRWEDVAYLFSVMAAINKEKHASCFFPFGDRAHEPWSEKNYRTKMLPRLALQLAGKVVPECSRRLCCEFLCCAKPVEALGERLRLKNWLQEQTPELQKKLMYLRAQLHDYLPHTLGNKKYKLSEEQGIAIPSVQEEDPALQLDCYARFENIDIMVNYTFQHYLTHGLSMPQIKKIIQACQRETGRRHAHQSSGRIDKIVKKYFPNSALDALDPEDHVLVSSLHEKLRLDESLIIEYLHMFTFQAFFVPSEKITSFPEDLSYVFFHKVAALSAGLGDDLIDPLNLEQRLDISTDEEALSVLLDPSYTEMTAGQIPPQHNTVIDLHAYFEEFDSREAAQILLANAPSNISYCLYHDADGNMALIDRKGCKVPNGEQTCLPGDRIFFCNQKQIAWTDISFPKAGSVLLIVHGQLTLTELISLVKNVLQCGKEQKIVLWFSPQAHQEIMAKYNAFDRKAVLNWCAENEGEVLYQELLPAFVNQVRAIYRAAALHEILSEPCSDGMKKEQYRMYRDLFVEKMDHDSYLEQGKLECTQNLLRKFNEACQDFQNRHYDLLDAEQQKMVSIIRCKAQRILGAAGPAAKVYSQLDAIVISKQDPSFEELDHEASRRAYIPKPLDPSSLFGNEECIANFILKDTKSTIWQGYQASDKNRTFLVSLSNLFPDAQFDPSLFATENFVGRKALAGKIISLNDNQKKIALFKKYLPKANYLLHLTKKVQSAIYKCILLSGKDADQVRKWIEEFPKDKRKHKFHAALFDVDGTCWAKSSEFHDTFSLSRILAQMQYFNGKMRNPLN